MPNDRLSLTVTLPAEEWEAHKRRIRFLQAALAQSMGERHRLRQWFTAGALAAMRLPGMPSTPHGVILRADRENWIRRAARGERGERYEFHFAGLPRPAFDEIVRRVLALPAAATSKAEALPPAAGVPSGSDPVPPTATPPWLLYLLRAIRSGAAPDAPAALEHLASLMPWPLAVPTLAEVSEALRSYGR